MFAPNSIAGGLAAPGAGAAVEQARKAWARAVRTLELAPESQAGIDLAAYVRRTRRRADACIWEAMPNMRRAWAMAQAPQLRAGADLPKDIKLPDLPPGISSAPEIPRWLVADSSGSCACNPPRPRQAKACWPSCCPPASLSRSQARAARAAWCRWGRRATSWAAPDALRFSGTVQRFRTDKGDTALAYAKSFPKFFADMIAKRRVEPAAQQSHIAAAVATARELVQPGQACEIHLISDLAEWHAKGGVQYARDYKKPLPPVPGLDLSACSVNVYGAFQGMAPLPAQAIEGHWRTFFKTASAASVKLERF